MRIQGAIFATLGVGLLASYILLTSHAAALEITTTIRDTSEARTIELCQILHDQDIETPGSWTLDECSTAVFAKGMRAAENGLAQKLALETAQSTIEQVREDVKDTFPDTGITR